MAYPEFRLDHLKALSDNTGLIQHAIYSVPNRRMGYTTDDNARALVVALEHFDRTGDLESLQLVSTYLSFLHYAQTANGKFHNYMSYDQMFLDEEGSEDCFGRTLVACGFALTSGIHENVKRVADELFNSSLRWIPSLTSSRSKAYALAALWEYQHAHPDSKHALELIALTADSLVDMFQRNSEPDWVWYEPFLTYCNGLLPHAMFLAYDSLRKKVYLDIATQSISFLTSVTIINGVFQPIGSEGWYIKGQQRAYYDQQPVDATSLICAAKAAVKITGDYSYNEIAGIAFRWFHGSNSVGEPLFDPVSGGCFDGLHQNRLNLNQGAESTLAYLMAHLAMVPEENQRLIPPP